MFATPTRQEINLRIIDYLKEIVLNEPNLRLGQILVATNLLEMSEAYYPVDPFYEEPYEMAKRMLESDTFSKFKSILGGE